MKQDLLLKQHPRKRELLDGIATWGLLVAGILGVLFPLVNSIVRVLTTNIPILSSLNFTYDSTTLVGILVSVLSISIGLERYASFQEMREEAQHRHSELIEAIDEFQKAVEQCRLNTVEGKEIEHESSH